MITLDWLSGFIDGEGCFNFLVTPSKFGIGYYVSPQFVLNGVCDEVDYLINVKKFLEECDIVSNKIRIVRYEQWGEMARTQCILTITKNKTCKKLCALLRDKLHTHKGKELGLWEQGIDMIMAGKHKTIEGFLNVIDILEQLQTFRSPRRQRKYTKNYFLDKFAHTHVKIALEGK